MQGRKEQKRVLIKHKTKTYTKVCYFFLWKLIINSKKGNEMNGLQKKVNVLIINKRAVGRIEKLIRGGETLI